MASIAAVSNFSIASTVDGSGVKISVRDGVVTESDWTAKRGTTVVVDEIFATVQNEYSDWLSGGQIRPRHLLREASSALTDKLFVAPLVQTANWCNRSGFDTFMYVYGHAEQVRRERKKIKRG